MREIKPLKPFDPMGPGGSGAFPLIYGKRNTSDLTGFRGHQGVTHALLEIHRARAPRFKMDPMFLACGNGLRFSDRQTFSAIRGNGTVDQGTTIDALPGIKHDKEIREPL